MKLPAFVATAALFVAFAHAEDATANDDGIVDMLIMGGKEVPIGQRLYTVGCRENATSITSCGGSLITDRHVLTAAHCVDESNFVAVGTHYNTGELDGVNVAIKSKLKHPKYREHLSNYDYGIFELATPVDTKKYPTITLANASGKDIVEGAMATVIGWGQLSVWGSPSDVLLEVNVPIVSTAYCKSKFARYEFDDSMFCAGGQRGRDSCGGDSGGPLVVKGKDGSDILIGSVSGGAGCGTEGWPSVYARVPTVADWIKANAPGVKFSS